MDDLERTARMIRLIAIRGYYRNGDLSKEEAVQLLAGPLTPGDETTVRDDSKWLEASGDDILDAFKK